MYERGSKETYLKLEVEYSQLYSLININSYNCVSALINCMWEYHHHLVLLIPNNVGAPGASTFSSFKVSVEKTSTLLPLEAVESTVLGLYCLALRGGRVLF